MRCVLHLIEQERNTNWGSNRGFFGWSAVHVVLFDGLSKPKRSIQCNENIQLLFFRHSFSSLRLYATLSALTMKWCKQIASVGSLVNISNIRCALLKRHPYSHLRTFGTRCGAGGTCTGYGTSIEGVISNGIEARPPEFLI